jgi:hypothetical protein
LLSLGGTPARSTKVYRMILYGRYGGAFGRDFASSSIFELPSIDGGLGGLPKWISKSLVDGVNWCNAARCIVPRFDIIRISIADVLRGWILGLG